MAKKITYGDFAWAVSLILSGLLMILHYVRMIYTGDKEYFAFVSAILMFVAGVIIGRTTE